MEENESEWSEWSDFENDVESMERIDDIKTSTPSKASLKDENVEQMVPNSVQEPEDNFVHAITSCQIPIHVQPLKMNLCNNLVLLRRLTQWRHKEIQDT